MTSDFDGLNPADFDGLNPADFDGLNPADFGGRDPWMSGDVPGWVGDVTLGVDAWTKREAPPAPPPDESTRVPDADPESVARKILLDQLTGQARSRKELADRLAKRNVPDEIATRLLDRFEEVGLVDDEAFARLWTTSRQSSKGLARRALAQELRRKGVADEVAREALDELDPADEEASARDLVRRKLRTMSRLDDTTKTRRLLGMLARKGYPSGMAMAVIREEVKEISGFDGEDV
jgi:regulatory protein